MFTVSGFSFGGRGQGSGLAFVQPEGWGGAPGKATIACRPSSRAPTSLFQQYPSAASYAFAPPAVLELGNATGFDFELDRPRELGHDKLMQARGQLLGIARKNPAIGMLRPNGLDDEPQYQLDIDWEKASALGADDQRHQRHPRRPAGAPPTSTSSSTAAG